MYEEQLFAAAPSRCRLYQGPSLASRSLGGSFSPTFFHLGVHSPPPWLLGTAVAISQSQNWLVLWWRVSTPFPLSLGQLVFVEGCGFVVCCSGHRAFRPGCPLGLHECGRADVGAAEVAAIAQSPRSTWRGLAESKGSGAPRLSRAGLGSLRGDRARDLALFPSLATLHTSFQPPASLQTAEPWPCLFFQPGALHPAAQIALEAASTAPGRGSAQAAV